MKVLLLFLLIPLSYADSPPTCDELGKIIQGKELDLQKKFLYAPGTECSNLTPDQLGSDLPIANTELIEKHKCSSLSVIETELERLKNQEAILSGLDKLKNSIQVSQKETDDKNLKTARKAGATFVSALSTAQSLEVLLQSKTKEEVNFLAELKKIPEGQRRNELDFKVRINELCKNTEKSDAITACNKQFFNPGQEAITEINGLLEKAEPTEKQIESWQAMLLIKRKNADPEKSSYSFTEMQMEMLSAFNKLDQGAELSREELDVIKNLDQFENAKGLSFVEDIAKIKDQYKNQFAADRFRFLIEDAQRRQQHEVQSKVSVLWHEVSQVSNQFSDQDYTNCTDAKLIFESAVACQSMLTDKIRNQLSLGDKAYFEGLLDPLKTSIDYQNKLSSVVQTCLPEIKKQGQIPEKCLSQISADKAKIQDQIFQLNLIKDKIGFQNQALMGYRNFALYKWGTQKCPVIDSSINDCAPEDSISKEAGLLTHNVLDISLVYTPKPEAESTAQVLCEDDSKNKTSSEERLCAFFNDTTSNIIQTDNEKKDEDALGPVSAPKREGGTAESDMWLNGLSQAFNQAANQWRNRPYLPNLINPYSYNYNPYNTGAGPKGIADSILFNARYYGGYGYYMPTKGYQPYSAFGTSAPLLTPYTTINTNGSSYFGK